MWNKLKRKRRWLALLPALFFLFVTLPSKNDLSSLRGQVALQQREWLQFERAARLLSEAPPRNGGGSSMPLVTLVEEAARQLGLKDKILALRPVPGAVEFEMNPVSLEQILTLFAAVEEIPSGGKVSFLKLTPADAQAMRFSVEARVSGS